KSEGAAALLRSTSVFAGEAIDASSASVSSLALVFGPAGLRVLDAISLSCIAVYSRKMGGPIALPDRAFDGGRESRGGPVAGKKEIGPGGLGRRPPRILLRQRGESCAPFLDDDPGRQLVARAGYGSDVVPDLFCQILAWGFDPSIGRADRRREPTREGEKPFHRHADDAHDPRLGLKRLASEMGIHDGAELGWRWEARHKQGGDCGRQGENDRVVRRKLEDVLAEIELVNAIAE